MRRVLVCRACHREGSASRRIRLDRVYCLENDGAKQMVRILTSIRDDLGGLEPVLDLHRHVALDDRKQVPVKRNACQLGAMPPRVVQTPSRLRRVTISRVQKWTNERMVQSYATVEERNVSRVRSCGRLQEAVHRPGPFSLFFRWHPFEVVREDGGGGKGFNRPKGADGLGDLGVRSVADNNYVFRKL